MLALVDGLSNVHLALLILALVVVFAFEFVNGFHDTANAVATVIYTNSLPPWIAVLWSGFCNFLGVYLGGIAVAFSIVHLLPVDLLININTHAGLAMVFALLASSILWNFGTWYLALPSSSSHALIGSILGVGLAHGLMTGKHFGEGVNWVKAQEVGLTLLVSPLIGFGLAFILLDLARRLIPRPELLQRAAAKRSASWLDSSDPDIYLHRSQFRTRLERRPERGRVGDADPDRIATGPLCPESVLQRGTRGLVAKSRR